MSKITDDELKALRAKHPRGVIVLNAEPEEGEEGARQFAFRKIDRASYARYRAETKAGVAAGGGTGEEEAALARSLLVFPDVAAFDQLREDAPGVVAAFGGELLADASAGLLVTRDEAEVGVDALLAFAHHDPDTADPLVRAGAFLVLEFLHGFRALLVFLGKLFSKKKR